MKKTKNKKPLTCADCKYVFIEDLYNQWCCSIKNPNFRYELIPVSKYGNPTHKCKKFKLHEWSAKNDQSKK